MTTRDLVDLATRIQRRRDFTAHLLGFLTGAAVLTTMHILGTAPALQYAASMLVWATALSTQHFRHVLRGPVTAADITAERARLATTRAATAPVDDLSR